jgi:CRISPR/Cas system CMR subunit Cmr6 (Cas7 group RAMP superfamily)
MTDKIEYHMLLPLVGVKPQKLKQTLLAGEPLLPLFHTVTQDHYDFAIQTRNELVEEKKEFKQEIRRLNTIIEQLNNENKKSIANEQKASEMLTNCFFLTIGVAIGGYCLNYSPLVGIPIICVSAYLGILKPLFDKHIYNKQHPQEPPVDAPDTPGKKTP